MNWYYVIPFWFFIIIKGRQSDVTPDSYFFAVQNKYGQYVVDSNANNVHQFRKQFDSAKAVTPDSFILVQFADTDFVKDTL